MDHVELSMYRQLPPLLLFLLIAPIVVLVTDKGWLSVIIALAAVVLTNHDRSTVSRSLFAIPLVYMTYYIAEEDADRWYMSIKLIPVVIACAGAAAVVFGEIHRRDKDAHAVRTLVYTATTAIAAAVGMLYARELVRLMEEDSTLTLHLTTVRRNCTDVTASGFLFDDTPFSPQCPTRLWEHIRINLMLGVQLYVTYTLTTSMQDSIKVSNNKYTVGVLSVTECLLWTLASALQFDTIEDCHELTTSTVVCLTLASICHVFIHAEENTAADSGGSTQNIKWLHSHHVGKHHKLKL